MDSYKKLQLEFNGIRNVIVSYTSSNNIINFVNELEKGLMTNDSEKIFYCLNEIIVWYRKNISDILSNVYVHNHDDHERNKKILEEIENDLQSYDFSLIDKNNMAYIDAQAEEKTSVFLSHCSANKKYADALEKIIIGMGIKNNQLIYTSHPLHKIPLNENIYNYLRKHINQKVFVIILWSNEYLESPSCLNELGAAWVTQTDYINIYTPDFSFGNPKYHECAVDTKKMGAVLNCDTHCKASMLEFRNKILTTFNLDLDDQTWTYLLDQFISDIA